MKPVTMTGGYDGQPWVQPRQCYRTSSCHVGNDGTRRTVRGRSTGTLTCLTGLGGMLLARGGVGSLASFTRRLASSMSSPLQPSLSRKTLTRRGPMLTVRLVARPTARSSLADRSQRIGPHHLCPRVKRPDAHPLRCLRRAVAVVHHRNARPASDGGNLSQRRRLTFRNSPAMRSSTGTLKYKDHPMARMTGGEAIVDSLLRHGIDTVFGLPGVQTYGLFDAFARASNSLRLINARHEQTTAYMALGYACATGRPSAYAVVPGPGVLNTGAALATAWSVNAPVLCLTGQVPSMMIGRGRGQLHELPDQLATLRSLLKWVERIEHPSQASHLTARAFQEMLSGRPGPVALEMPWDQFTASAEITPQGAAPPAPEASSPTPSASPPWRSC